MRRLAASLLTLLAIVLPAASEAAGKRVVPVTIMLATGVADSAQRTMPPALWARLVDDYVAASKVVPFAGSALPTLDQCHAGGAAYAVAATFELAPRLPGLAQDTDRKYGIARIDLLNCITGTRTPTKVVRIESDPLSIANAGDFESNVEVTWTRSVTEKLAHNQLVLSGVARITRIDGTIVYIDGLNSTLAVNQVIRVFADKDTHPRPPIELVVSDVTGRMIQAVFNVSTPGVIPPHVGDYVEPFTPTNTPSPAPSPK